ncbi:MAG: hypothetical protein MIO92_05645, partial [Methanosarcinaceae archaeon]|nr:hypothetical protein [Methanosarcinaceae archaeon]
AYMVPGNTKEEKRVISSMFKKPRDTMEYGIEFLYLIGNHGQLVDGNLHLSRQLTEAFFAKNPRVKRKFLKGMESAGLTVMDQDDGIIVRNIQYPRMMAALKSLAEACSRNSDSRVGRFLFSCCDFQVLKADFQPKISDMLRHVLSSSTYERMLQLHEIMFDMSYVPTLNFGGISDWWIQYQGDRKIKSSPFLEFEYDERLKSQFVIRVKCASTNRLVPFLHQQSASLQEDFFHHANNCGGESCGWCKTRKGMGPSVIAYGCEKRTICWYMQRHFTEINTKTVDLINQYAQYHEVLAAV